MLSFCRAFAFSAFIRKPSASLLQSARIAPSRESNLESCQQRTKFAALRYESRPTSLFFRAKRGFRDCFGVKNPIRNCIWKCVRNGFSAPKRDVDPISPCIFFKSGWDTEVVFGCSITDWTVYRHTFRKDCTFKNEICAQTDRKNISIKLNKDI